MPALFNYNSLADSFFVLRTMPDIGDFRYNLWTQNIFSTLFRNYTDRGKMITSAVVYPINLDNFISLLNTDERNITVGDEPTAMSALYIKENNIAENNSYIASYSLGVDCGNTFTGSYIDFDSITEYKLYIPFVGIVDIEYQLLKSGFTLTYYLDITTGIANVDMSKLVSGVPRVFKQYTCQIGEPITFSSGDTGVLRDKVVRVVSTIASLALAYNASTTTVGESVDSGKTITRTTRNPSTGRQIKDSTVSIGESQRAWSYTTSAPRTYAMVHAVDAVADLVATHGSATVRNTPQSGALFAVDLVPKVFYRRPTPVANTAASDSDYRKLIGKPLYEVRTLSALTGYTEISSVHIESSDGAPMYSEEIEEIEELLSHGFIINAH